MVLVGDEGGVRHLAAYNIYFLKLIKIIFF